MSLTSGTRIGPYEILSAIGVGGMGEVYRASDTKLNRDVALKVLPEAFASDPDRLARFKREAQVLASLNHPHIAAIYGFEDSGETHALVLELVEGPTLADRIAKGAIPLDEVLPIARQIAEALEAAHEQGIIHRDLKPANIKVRDNGTVKVLDFGLAKLADPAVASSQNVRVTASPTITTPAMMTGVGMILGTAAYMSPEQAKGKPADKRSDIWAFGCVLYEMLTGKRAFEGEDVSETLAAVLRGEPDWTDLPVQTPPSIALVLRRCLQKNRAERIADVSTVLFVLGEPALIPERATKTSPSGTLKTMALVGAGCLVLGVLGTMGANRALGPLAPPLPVTRLIVPLGPRDSFSTQGRHLLALSPDGTRLVYAANQQLYVRALNQLDAVQVRKTGEAAAVDANAAGRGPFFSPDGRWIGFWQLGKLKKVLVDGGTPVDICEIQNPLGATWTDQNTIVFGQGLRGIFRVSADGGEPEQIIRDPGGVAHGPQLLPDRHSVLFTLRRGDNSWDDANIVVENLIDHHRDIVIRGATDARYLGTGHVLYVSNGTLFGQRFDLATLKVQGTPVALIERVAQAPFQTGAAHFSVAQSGTLAYVPGSFSSARATSKLVWVDRQGREIPLGAPPRAYAYPRVSPDGTRVAVSSVADTDNGFQQNIFIWQESSGPLTQLTAGGGGGRYTYPVWTPDGRRLAFANAPGGDSSVWWQAADGSTPAERLTDETALPTSFTPDGGKLVISDPNRGELGVVTVGGARKPESIALGNVTARNGEISPNGRWLAYETTGAATAQVFVREFDKPQGRRWQISTDGGRMPVWRRDGRELLYVGQTGIMRVAVEEGSDWKAEVPVKLIDGPYAWTLQGIAGRMYDVSPDGRVLALKLVANSAPAPDRIVVVQNWIEELKQRVPTK
jgi:serine/threonine-protein kinase